MPRRFAHRWFRIDLYAALERLQEYFSRRTSQRSREAGKPIFARPELVPLDLRNPPSDALGSVMLPLSLTAAELTAGIYFESARIEAEKWAQSQVGNEMASGTTRDWADGDDTWSTSSPSGSEWGGDPSEGYERNGDGNWPLYSSTRGLEDFGGRTEFSGSDFQFSMASTVTGNEFLLKTGSGGSGGSAGIGFNAASGDEGISTLRSGGLSVANNLDLSSSILSSLSSSLSSLTKSGSSVDPRRPKIPLTDSDATANRLGHATSRPSAATSSPSLASRPLPYPVIFAGSGVNEIPTVKGYDATNGEQTFSATPYESTFRGGVRVGTGDINRDGYPDVVTAPGPGRVSTIHVLDGRTGQPIDGPLGSFTAYGPGFTGGVHVAAADVNGDGRVDVITAAALPSGARIKVFSGRDGTELANFRVSGPAFQNGITVAAADLTGDQKAEVVVGAASGGRVRTYDPLTGTIIDGPLGNFRAFGPGYSGAVFVGSDALAGDVDADGTPDLAIGTGSGQKARVRVFSGATGEILHDFSPFGSGVSGGARVALAYVDNDDQADIVVGSGPGTSSAIRVFSGRTGEQFAMPLGAYAPFGNSQGGVFVAASNDPAVPIGVVLGFESVDYNGAHVDLTVSLMSDNTYRWDYVVTNDLFWGGSQINFFEVAFSGPNAVGIWDSANDLVWSNPPDGGTFVAGWSMIPGIPSPSQPILTGGGTGAFSFTTTPRAVVSAHIQLDSSTGFAFLGPGDEVPIPAITGMSTDTGTSNSDRITFDTTPTLSGTAEPGATVTVYRQGPGDPTPVSVVSTTATGGGLWTFTYGSALADASYSFTAKATVSGVTSPASAPMTVTVDTTPPGVSVSVSTGTGNPNQTYSVQPPVTVTASDLVGFPSPATVTLDIDRNNDGDFLDSNETGAATAALSSGAAVFTSYLALTPGTTVRFRARVTDLAGNEGTSSPVTVQILSVGTPWTTIDQTARTRSGQGLLADGDVSTSHLLDLDVSAYACDCQDPFLVYHSQEAAPAPVIQAVVQSDNALGLPAHVYGTLTWDGGTIGGVDYNLSQLTPGGQWIFSYAPGGSPTTGRHTYTLDLFVDYPGSVNDHSLSITGDTFIVNRSASPYGAGWSFSNTDTLYSIAASGSYPAGLLRAFGKGGWAFYADAGGGQYTEPAGDAGVLVASGGGWVYTSPSGRVLTFDSSGRMTTWTHLASSETLTYTYDASGGVATMKGPDGGVATFAYSSGKLATITAPGNRVTTLAYTGTDLTQITNPAAGAHTFAYSAHRLISETSGATRVSYAYDANGLVSSVTAGATSAITPAARTGLGGGAMAEQNGSLPAILTDALGQNWTTWFNLFGQVVRTLDPVGAVRAFERDGNGFVTRSTDALNRTTTYTVDSAGRILGETRPDGTSASWVYGGAYGSLTRYTDYNGGIWTYTNDANGNRLTETDPLNHTTTYTYSSGLLQTVKDATGNVTTYLYDGSRRPTGALLGGAVTGTTGYDVAGNANTYTDARGNVTTTTYDGAGRAIGTQNPLGQRTTSVYDAGGNLLWTSDGLGRITSYAYDAAGRVEAVIEASGTGLQRRTTSVYDAAGQLVATIDPLGQRTTIVYDAAGRSVAVIDALGNRATTVYDLEGQVTATVDPLGRMNQYHYDLLGRTDAITDPLGHVASTVYDANSNVLATIDPLGNRSTNTYDAANRLTSNADPLGNRTSYGYDLANRLTSTTDPNGNVTTTAYDSRNRIWSTIDALGKRTTFGYDAADNRITVTDPLNHTATTTYDALNRAVESIDGEGNRSTVVYDAAGMVLATVDPRGNRTTTQYDALGRAEATVDALGKRATVVYDAADRAIATVDPLGNRTTFSYDAAGRLVSTLDALNFRTTNIYDAAGQLSATQNALGERTTYGYDAAGQSVSVTDALNHTWTTAFDAAGRAISATDPNGHTVTTVYDNASRVLATIDPLGKRTTYGYDAAFNLISVTDPLNHTTTSHYDALNRVKSIENALNQRTTTTFDDAGNVKTAANTGNAITTYEYDKADRLIRTTDPAGNVWTTQYDAASNVLFTTDPRGNTTSYGYDKLNRVEVVVDPLLKRTTTTYDDAGNVRTVKDARNNVTTYGYDARNMAMTTTNAAGKVWTTQYDALGRVTRTIDPRSHDAQTTYDAAGRAIESIDALGKRTTTVYDPAGNVLAVVDALGRRTSYGYDAADRSITTTDAAGNVWTTIYDAAGNAIARTDPRNHTTTTVYDELNRVKAVENALNQRTTTTYDAAGNVRTVTDALNLTITYGYDTRDLRTTLTDALGNVWTTAYDKSGNAIESIDPLNHTTTTVYDELNRVKAVVDPLGNRTTTVYDAVGNVESVKNARGNTTTFAYDALNRPIATTDALGNVWTTQYDAAGNAEARIDPLGYRTTTVYDVLDRPVATVTPLGLRTTTGYDAVGNVTTVTNPLGLTTTTGFDALNRQTTVTDPRGYTTTGIYDAVGNRTSLIDASNNRTTWVYDLLDRVATETNALGVSATTAYDAIGRVSSETDRLGRRKDYAYDNTGHLLTEKWYASGGSLVQTQTFTYDAAGQMLTAQDPDGTYTLAYDNADRVSNVQEPFSQILTFAYDANGNRTQIRDSKGGAVTTVVFDALDRQTSERIAGSATNTMRFDHAYNDRGELERVRRYADLAGTNLSAVTSYTYDADGRATLINNITGSGAAAGRFTYTYDAASRLTSKKEGVNTYTFTYDNSNQLTADGATTFGYDATGNRTNAGYVTSTGNRTTSDGTWTYTYDAAGNMIKRSKGVSSATWVYGYDHNNQMLTAAYSATDGGTVTQRVTYAYDAWSNRVQRQEWTGGSTSTLRFALDGWDPAKANAIGTENFDVWARLDGSNALIARFVFGPRVDEVIGRQDPGVVTAWYLVDYQGSVRRVVNNADTVLATTRYSAYGQILDGSIYGGYGYTGREYDGVIGGIGDAWYMRARIFLPDLGKFLSEDPGGFAAGDSNLYRYVGNSPSNTTDPSGMQAKGGESRDYQRRGRLIAQYINSLNLRTWARFYEDKPLYEEDSEFKKLVKEYVAHVKTAIPNVPVPTNKVNPFDYWPDLQDSQLPDPMTATEYEVWSTQQKKLMGQVVSYAYKVEQRDATPRIYRFAFGIGMGIAKTGNGIAELVANPDKAIEGIYKVATDSNTREHVWDAIVKKLSDGSAENLGELSVEIPLTASGVGGAARFGGKIVVTISKDAAQILKAAGPKAKDVLRQVWKTQAATKTTSGGARFGGVTPGKSAELGYDFEQLSSFPAKLIKQKTDSDCLATCLEMVIKDSGSSFNVFKFAKKANMDEKGITFPNTMTQLERLNFEYKYFRKPTIDEVLNETLYSPVIVGLRNPKGNTVWHTVIVDVVLNDGKIVVRDPAIGKAYLIERSVLEEYFAGEAMVVTGKRSTD